ncbi:MAG: hypothetical protein QOF20_1833 [Acidimicrobiaceae bacterium]|jgi:hypothetical protein|nr:hypothetical protein [Acidimicrobiaceae bacterium]MDQ1365692.1 hypothetical protein [Acidimicrobiaceae bacterium]MDQ1369480.1 hypothetical protein [Acidimicrobiaceae bacterium]MDQ1401483.1 hypothetical protein [Acidimicrobiaceae bacterium]MDQ1412878.1 hypothetical protein [Acidimicrobiaceae bacterium]
MSDEQVENQSNLQQQQDPRGDLLKARPGGDTDIVDPNPNSGYRDQKPESAYEGEGSDGNPS